MILRPPRFGRLELVIPRGGHNAGVERAEGLETMFIIKYKCKQIFILSYRILGVEIPPGVGALPLHDGRRVFLRGDFIDAEVDAAEVHAVHREGCGRREQ